MREDPINELSLQYNDVMMGAMASQVTSLTIVYSTVYLARARPAVPLGLWSITSSLRGNLYVPRLHKFIKWFADNDVTHRN